MFEQELRALFPQHCVGACGCFDTALCTACMESLLQPGTQTAMGLGEVAWVTSYGLPLAKTIVQRLKFHSTPTLGPIISPYLEALLQPPTDVVIPVPLHPVRQHQRGYNQAERLCATFGKRLQPGLLVRNRWTWPQAKLKKHHRERNLRGAFATPFPGLVRGKHICLVDDVFTTGSTLRACADALREAGAASVNALVFAKSDDSIDTRPQNPQTST